MKAAQPATAASSAKNNIPFFNKESEQGFFHSSVIEQPFFSKSINSHAGIQAKLSINQPGDIYEKEADTMADKVVQRLGEPSGIQAQSFSSQNIISTFVQKKCAHCEEEEKLQEKENDDKKAESIQTKPIVENNGPKDGHFSLARPV